MDTRARTLAYIAAFDARDLDTLNTLLAKDFVLTDPDVSRLTPKSAVLDYVSKLFSAHQRAFEFRAESVLVEGDRAVIEFVLTLDDTVLQGMDLLEWGPDGLRALRAHLTVQSDNAPAQDHSHDE